MNLTGGDSFGVEVTVKRSAPHAGAYTLLVTVAVPRELAGVIETIPATRHASVVRDALKPSFRAGVH